jgi:hypothetical protein
MGRVLDETHRKDVKLLQIPPSECASFQGINAVASPSPADSLTEGHAIVRMRLLVNCSPHNLGQGGAVYRAAPVFWSELTTFGLRRVRDALSYGCVSEPTPA